MYTAEWRIVARQAAKAEVLKRILWFVGGSAVTGIAYIGAGAGGSYIVFWGAIAYGGYRLLRTPYYWLNPNALMKKI